MIANEDSQVRCPKCGKVNKGKSNYCTKCGFHFQGESTILFQIRENLKVALYASITCISIFVIFMIFVNIAIIFEYGSSGFISILIIWPLILGLVIWASLYLKNLTKFRRFTITKEYIELMVPHKPPFKIKWTEFNSIEIKKQESLIAIPSETDDESNIKRGLYTLLSPNARFVYFSLIFKSNDVEWRYEFESGRDFKVRSRKKILLALEKYAKEYGKNFTGWRRKDKRKKRKELLD